MVKVSETKRALSGAGTAHNADSNGPGASRRCWGGRERNFVLEKPGGKLPEEVQLGRVALELQAIYDRHRAANPAWPEARFEAFIDLAEVLVLTGIYEPSAEEDER